MNNKDIIIEFKNGENCYYNSKEYTDYQYDGKYFIVIYDEQWIGFYNLDEVRYIEIAVKQKIKNDYKITFYDKE